MLGLLRFQILDSLFFLNSASLKRAVPASIEFVDIAGLVKGASQGEGLGNKFLWHIRQVDSILQVVCSFEDNDIVLVNGKVDPKTDIDVINLKLVFSDLDQLYYFRRKQKIMPWKGFSRHLWMENRHNQLH
ncbi:uncharacterized protein LOC111276037 isoform X4 [Durio zibethinus]|uniref:Uncharacterized protein LOC111276037 isoform X4 n=1 Tax=Durio zibethinus TaxID=66656 RepID=A0A6P5WPR7_DURZI|nr:uncharacterized protein LOC111276037 isoform X4 [Durio zibethinus]